MVYLESIEYIELNFIISTWSKWSFN